MSKLVDKERLARLAKALDDRAKAAVKAEETRALAAEQAIDAKADANAAAIVAINNEENGILAQAKAHVAGREEEINKAINAKVDQEAYNSKMELLDKADEDQQSDILELQGKVQGLEQKMGDEDMAGIQKAIDEFREEQKGIDAAQDARVIALEEAVNGNAEKEVPGLKAEMDAVEGRVKAIEDADFAKQIKDEEDARKAADQGLETRIKANEDFVAAQPAIDAEQNRRLGVLEAANAEGGAVANAIKAVADDLADFKGEQAEKENAQDQAIAAKVATVDYEAKMALLDAEDDKIAKAVEDEAAEARKQEGILDNAIKQEALDRDAADKVLEGRIKANEDNLAVVQGNEAQEGSIAKAEKDAKDYADQKIAELVNSAPEEMNTLKELSDAIAAHQEVYTGYVTTVANNIATAKADAVREAGLEAANKDAALKAELQKEIDDDVKAEADLRAAEEVKIRSEFAAADSALEGRVNQKIADDIAAAVAKEVQDRNAAIKVADDRAKEEEADIRADFAAADGVLEGRIATLEGLVVGGEGEGLEAVVADVAKNKQDIVNLKAADVTLQSNIDKKVDKEDGKSLVADSEIAKIHEHANAEELAKFVVGDKAALDKAVEDIQDHEDRVKDLENKQAAHSHAKMEQDIAANKAAIEKEVEDRDAAIAEAIKDFATDAEVKAMLGNVVNSLSLKVEDNKVILNLGGTDGIAVAEASLDMATDAEIDAIIAGLDAE